MTEHRFHARHGANIKLRENATIASRLTSFNDGLVFTDRCLDAHELFLVEIEHNDYGWNGSLRIGITYDPVGRESLPHYSIPGLTTDASAFIYTLDRTEVDDQLRAAWSTSAEKMQKMLRQFPAGGARINFDCLFPREMPAKRTRFFSPRKNSHNDEFQARLVDSLPSAYSSISDLCPEAATYEGSRVGIFYTRETPELILLYCILNGDCRGPFPFEVLPDAPLFVVCDVYGYTKTIRIVPLYQVPSLQNLCRETIVACPHRNLDHLPLPSKMLRFLAFQSS